MLESHTSMVSRGRLLFLDALRGLAACYVVVYHMLLLPEPDLKAPRWAASVALSGGMGVTLFFMVSAFSLCYTMPLRLKESRPTLAFYWHRFFRIAPLFYVLIAATLIRDFFIFHATHPVTEIASSVLLIFNLVPGGAVGFVWAGWTIGVEVVFYALFPLIYGRTRSLEHSIALLFACLLAWQTISAVMGYLPIPEPWKNTYLTWSAFRHFPIFASGVVLYHLFARWTAMDDARRVRLGDMFVWAGMFGFWDLVTVGHGYYWQSVVFGALFIGLGLSPWRIFVNRLTAYLGKISYSIYLNHPTIVWLLAPAYRKLYQATPYVSFGFLASLALTFVVVLALSTLTYRFIEAPGIALGRRLADRVSTRRAIGPSLPAVGR